MEDGEVRLESIVKVIDHMRTLSREDLIAKMMNSPAKQLAKLTTAWQRFLFEFNNAGFLDLMSTVLNEISDGLQGLTKWTKENSKEIQEWKDGIKTTYYTLKEALPILATFYGLFKGAQLINAGSIALGAYAEKIGSITKAAAALQLAVSTLKGVGLASGLLLIWDLVETLQGKRTLLSEGMNSDNLFVEGLSKTVVLLGEIILLMDKLAIAAVAMDAGFAGESFQRFRESIKELAPDISNYVLPVFDQWSLKMTGMAITFANIVDKFIVGLQMVDAFRKGNFARGLDLRDQFKQTPVLATDSQLWPITKNFNNTSQGMPSSLQAPPVNVTFNVPAGVGTVQEMESMITRVMQDSLVKSYNQALPNYVMRKGN